MADSMKPGGGGQLATLAGPPGHGEGEVREEQRGPWCSSGFGREVPVLSSGGAQQPWLP